MRPLVPGPRLHRVSASVAIVVLFVAGGSEVSNNPPKERGEVWDTGDDILPRTKGGGGPR